MSNKNWFIVENYKKDFPRTSHITKCLRWTLYDDFLKKFDYLYIGDVDILIANEKPDLIQQHINHANLLKLPYSNIVRSNKNPKRMSGLHFICTKPYFNYINKSQLNKFNNMIKSGKFNKYPSNESVLYQLIEESNMGFPNKDCQVLFDETSRNFNQTFFRPHHGIHLSIFNISNVKENQHILDSNIYRQYFKDVMSEFNVNKNLKEILKETNKNIKNQINLMEKYYESIHYLLDIKFNLEPEALNIINRKIRSKKEGYFCFVNIHSLMESQKNPKLKMALNQSSGNFPDGMGIAWTLGLRKNMRGTDMMIKLCSYDYRIFLYGNTQETLDKLEQKLKLMFPKIKIVGKISPPFRKLTNKEDDRIVNKINKANPDIVFVSLGAPKQEIWMAEHKGKVKAVQLGVGAAFDFITGNVKQAPRWMQKSGLEWFYRMFQQPRKTIYRMSLVPEFILRLIKWKIKN